MARLTLAELAVSAWQAHSLALFKGLHGKSVQAAQVPGPEAYMALPLWSRQAFEASARKVLEDVRDHCPPEWNMKAFIDPILDPPALEPAADAPHDNNPNPA